MGNQNQNPLTTEAIPPIADETIFCRSSEPKQRINIKKEQAAHIDSKDVTVTHFKSLTLRKMPLNIIKELLVVAMSLDTHGYGSVW